jgi:hypothetical protein
MTRPTLRDQSWSRSNDDLGEEVKAVVQPMPDVEADDALATRGVTWLSKPRPRRRDCRNRRTHRQRQVRIRPRPFGLEPIRSGQIVVDGEAMSDPTPSRMIARKLCYFPADHNVEGLALPRSMLENASITAQTLVSTTCAAQWPLRGGGHGRDVQPSGQDRHPH